MKIYQDILRAKLRELEQEYEHLRNRLEICEREDPGQIHQELESAKKEYDALQLRLKNTVETSRSLQFPAWQKSSSLTVQKRKSC